MFPSAPKKLLARLVSVPLQLLSRIGEALCEGEAQRDEPRIGECPRNGAPPGIGVLLRSGPLSL